MTGGERGFPIHPPHLEAGETEEQGGPEPFALGIGGWEVGEELGASHGEPNPGPAQLLLRIWTLGWPRGVSVFSSGKCG